MKRQAHQAFLIAASALALAACSWGGGTVETVNPNVYPSQYRQEILATLRGMLEDAVHIRGALVSDPVLTVVDKEQRYTACVRYAERDPVSLQYGEPVTRIAYFYAGHLNQLVKANDQQCATAAFRPFPALEKMCAVKDCG